MVGMTTLIMSRHAPPGFPDDVRWSWSLYGIVLTRPPGIHTDGHAPTFEAAKAEVRSGLEAMAGVGGA
jgi:hypothetical protein